MTSAEMAECAAAEWHSAAPARKALIVEVLFAQAWADMALELEPRVLALPIDPDLFPGGVIKQTFNQDGEPDDEVIRRIDSLTLAELRVAMSIQRGNILRENAHFKALACLLASKILDGFAEDNLVISEVPR